MRPSVTSQLLATMAIGIGFAVSGRAQDPSATAVPRWEPAKTRAFIVCLTRFKSETVAPFSTEDRLDGRLVELLQQRGVPRSQIVFLKDEQATTRTIRGRFAYFLRQSKPGETLFFYFGSHGGYDPKNGNCWWLSFDGSLPFAWVFDAVERDFKGARAFLAVDSCHSGGIVELAARRKTRIAYACLSSTYKHQIAWSGWRFVQCLIRALEGNPVVDRSDSGHIALQQLAGYTQHYMAFVAEGKPCFSTTSGFDPRLRLAPVRGQKKSPPVGKLVEVWSRRSWVPAEVVDVKGNRFKVHYTADTKSDKDEWVAKPQVRSPACERFPIGSNVELQGGSDRKWYPGVVLNTGELLHYCRYEGYAPAYNEWFGPSRIRPSFEGRWIGKWQNDVGEAGKDALTLRAKDPEHLTGTWAGTIPLTGERLGKHLFVFEAKTSNKWYRGAGRIDGKRLCLDYAAGAGKGKYSGWSMLQQTGAVDTPRRDPWATFAGKWSGTYVNSRGGGKDDTLTLSETGGNLRGVWSGLTVNGERLGNATIYLTATQGEVRYRVIGRIDRGYLILTYSATGKGSRYTGCSTLQR